MDPGSRIGHSGTLNSDLGLSTLLFVENSFADKFTQLEVFHASPHLASYHRR